MGKPDVKPFKLEGEEYAEIVHMGSAQGPQAIDINLDSMDSKTARKFSAWLLKAADEVDAYNRARKEAQKGTSKDG